MVDLQAQRMPSQWPQSENLKKMFSHGCGDKTGCSQQDLGTSPSVIVLTKAAVKAKNKSFPNPNQVVFVPKPNQTKRTVVLI